MSDKPAAAVEFQALIDAEWEWRMRADPLFATSTGDHRYDDRLPRAREADYAERLADLRAFRARLAAIERPALPPAQQLNYDIFGRLLDNEIGEHEFGAHYLPLSKAGGFHLYFPDLALFSPFDNMQDYERYIARLNAFRTYAADHIELMRAGLRQGYRPARVTLEAWTTRCAGKLWRPRLTARCIRPSGNSHRPLLEADAAG